MEKTETTQETNAPAPAGTVPFTVTENAAKRIAFLAEQEGDPSLMLRVTISGGGCSGFQYLSLIHI